jgi:hypothetical protein
MLWVPLSFWTRGPPCPIKRAVVVPSYLAWALRSVVRTPAVWLVGASTALVWPAWLVLAPKGIATREGLDIAAIYELAFAGLLAGAALGLVVNTRAASLLAQLTVEQRNRAEAACLMLMTAGGGALVLLPTALPGSAALPEVSLLPWFVAAAHVAALAFLVSRLTPRSGLRLALLVSLGWVIPALLWGAGPVGQAVASALDASAVLARESTPLETPALALADVTPVVAGVLAAWLLDPPRTARP